MATSDIDKITDAELLAQIIGRELKSAFPAKHQRVEGAKPNLVVISLSGNGFSDVSIEAYPGQIIGIARWISTYFGWIPPFQNDLGIFTRSIMIAGTVLAIMVLPTVLQEFKSRRKAVAA